MFVVFSISIRLVALSLSLSLDVCQSLRTTICLCIKKLFDILSMLNDWKIARHQSPPLDCKGVESHLDERLDTSLGSDTTEKAKVPSVVGSIWKSQGNTSNASSNAYSASSKILDPCHHHSDVQTCISREPTQAEGARGFESDIGPKAEGFIPQVPAPGRTCWT